ncbi:MAG: tryptophan--tRNA ligase, partial [Pseudonocardia sp.]|nr:tryptophan--tRNA ligase [Pseudonocardia sp.]
VGYDQAGAPGVANLLDILAGCTGDQPQRLAARFDGYGELKRAVADAVVDTLAPVRARYPRLSAQQDEVRDVLRSGAARARERAAEKLRHVRSAIGLLAA